MVQVAATGIMIDHTKDESISIDQILHMFPISNDLLDTFDWMIEVFVDATRCLTIRDEANVDAIVIDSIQTCILILGKSQSSQGLSTHECWIQL